MICDIYSQYLVIFSKYLINIPMDSIMITPSVIIQIVDCPDCLPIRHLGGFGSMQNTGTGCGSGLRTLFGISKHHPKSRSVNKFLERYFLRIKKNNAKNISKGLGWVCGGVLVLVIFL